MRDEEYFAIKDRAAAQLLHIPHVTGVGIGGRERNGRPTGEIVIKVFVERKKPVAEVPPEERIPPSFEGVPTDVVEMGPPVLIGDEEPIGVVNPHLMSLDEARTDPLRGGMYLRPDFGAKGFGGGGTLGCILRDKRNGSAIYGLTCHHVVVPSGARLSRSRMVAQTQAADPGVVELFAKVVAGADEKRRDAAVVRLNPFEAWLPAIKEIGFVTGTHNVTVEEAATGTYAVRKRGAMTKVTHGVVTAVGVKATFKVGDMVIKANGGPPLPPDKPVFFAYHGDSGSAVVNEDNEIVALIYAIENVDPKDASVTKPFALAYATPIRTVLELFAKVERLDLEVAVAGPNPTEATELQRVDLEAGAPVMTPGDVLERGDPAHRRPLLGGLQLLAEPMLGVPNATTLGCIVTDQNSPGAAFILTSYASVSAHGTRPPTSETDVGQPDNDGSSTGCCSNTVGRFAKGGPDHGAPTSALVRLGDDHQWLSEALEIGTLSDVHTLTALDVSSGTAHVRKYGAGSRLTGGLVTAVGGVEGTLPPGVRADAILIRPHPNSRKPNDDICFSHSVDRGAVVVDELNRVVGLLYDEIDIPDANGRHVIHGVATPIQMALDQLNAIAGINVKVATAQQVDTVQTVNNRTMASDGPAPSIPPSRRLAPEARTRLEWLREELLQTPGGQRVVALWAAHRREVRDLIDHNRKVATVWHRSGGPALLQALARASELRTPRIPTELNGVPVTACLERIARVFTRYGGEALRSDLARMRPLLPMIGGASLGDILSAVDGI